MFNPFDKDILKGVISSVYFWAIGLLAAAVVALFSGVSAANQGWPFYKIALVGGAVFLLFTAGLLLASFIISKFRLKCPDSWLHGLADEQAEAIQLWVPVDCSLQQHELMRDEPYITFMFYVSNESVYHITLGQISGSIQVGGPMLLSQPPTVVTNTAEDVVPGEVKHCYIRQPLTKAEAAGILNHQAPFNFNDLHGKITAKEGEVRSQDWNLQCDINNDALLRSYPKLEISVKKLTCTIISNFHTGLMDKPPDGLITMEIALKNFRRSPIMVESFLIEIAVRDKPFTAIAETGDIWEKRLVDEGGRPQTMGKQLNNLSDKPPLRVGPAEVSGDLQFVFKDAGAGMLSTIPYDLTVTDIFGEKHWIRGVINKPES